MSTAAVMAGVLLGVAGGAKAVDRDGVAPLLHGIGVPGAVVRTARCAVPVAELGTGAWLLSGAAATFAAAAACALAAAFVAALLVASARGVAEPCRCFGALDRARSHGVALARASLLLAAALAALALAAARRGEAAVAAPQWWLGVLLATTAVLAFALAGEVASFRTAVRRELIAQQRIGNGGQAR